MPKKDPKLQELAKAVKLCLEDEDFDLYKDIFFEDLKSGFIGLTDSRQKAKVKHFLHDCIGIVMFCSFSDIDEWHEMEMFANDNIDVLKQYLELPNGIPSHDTLERALSIIKESELQNVLVDILRNSIIKASANIDGYIYSNPELGIYIKDVVAIDGKETCKTGKPNAETVEGQRNLNMLNVQSTETGVTLSSTRINEKSNEIPEAQRVLKQLDLKGCVVTADAINTQKDTAKAIVEDAKADYCLAVKGNQGNLYRDIVDYFEDESLIADIKAVEGRYLKESEETSTKETIWEHYITDDIQWYEDKNSWKSLKSFGYVKKTIRDKKENTESVEKRYYICSFKPQAELLAIVTRRHWHIENTLHWVLDVVFKEDSLHTREKKALQNLGLINRFVLSILKILKPYYNDISYRYIRRKIGRDLEKNIPIIFATLKIMTEMGAELGS